ncbi:MAG: SIS domain-containing protein [Caulobacter sp.]|nr:SIS domain-containing protein [Caulobacter sp.]
MTAVFLAPSLTGRYFETLKRLFDTAEAHTGEGRALPLDEAVTRMVGMVRGCAEDGGKVMFVGNGGSAGIAGHMAIDYGKNGGFPAIAFNDPAALTCLANDLGFENVFARQIEMLGRAGDLLVAISSSGRSPNILRAVAAAQARNCPVITLSGFDSDNPLRHAGALNFHVASHVYGLVEIAHLALCHAALDIAMGWRPEERGGA